MYKLKRGERITTKPGLEAEWRTAVGANQDPYGHGVVEATVVACSALDRGLTPKEASDASDELNITGFMSGCMAKWVAYFHPRGEEFRLWWNTRHQLRDEGTKANKTGGVINPAIVSIGGR